ncbi:MAG TPA: FAD:protein FMN transferase [Polyangiaceae bacterium]
MRARPVLRAALLLSVISLAVACHEHDTPPPPPPPTSAAIPPAPVVEAAPLAESVDSSPASVAPIAFVPIRVVAEDKAMGTHIALAAYTTETLDEAGVKKAFEAAVAEIRRIEALMTTWRPDSELSQVNAAAGKTPVVVGQETFDVVKEAVHASEISEGTFDITFESLHGLWKFDQDLDPHPPTDAAIKAKLPFVGYHHIHLDPATRSVFLDNAGTKISLGGIAKGYAVDRATKVLRDAGLTSFYVQAGGDLFAAGLKPDGKPWSAGIRDPRGPEGSYFALIPLTEHAFSTAGDYERSYFANGKRYHHIIDPRTGKPATASRSVTIYARTALLADEVDDAVFILGPTKGMKLVDSLDGVGAVIVDAKNNVHVSKSVKAILAITGAPTDGL